MQNTMKSIDPYRRTLTQLFEEQYFAVLSSRGKQALHSCLVAFRAADDLRTLTVCTGRNTRKYANLNASSVISLLVDNRSNDVNDLAKATTVAASGIARELEGPAASAAMAHYLRKLPDLAEFANAPNTAIFEITVSSYDIVTQFQQVITLDLKP